MKLRDWMRAAEMSDASFAKAIGRERSFVTKLKNETLRPSIETAAAIQRLTEGAVTAVDYGSAPPRPAPAEGAAA